MKYFSDPLSEFDLDNPNASFLGIMFEMSTLIEIRQIEQDNPLAVLWSLPKNYN